MKTEIREKEDAGSMEAWGYAQYAGETEREREREKQKTIFQKMHTLNVLYNVHMCVFNAHFYTSPLKD